MNTFSSVLVLAFGLLCATSYSEAVTVKITGIQCSSQNNDCSTLFDSNAQAAFVPGAGGSGGVFVPDNTEPPTVTTTTSTTATETTATTTTLPRGPELQFTLAGTLPTDASELTSLKDNITTAIVDVSNEVDSAEDILEVNLYPGSIIVIVVFVQNRVPNDFNETLKTIIDNDQLIISFDGGDVTAEIPSVEAPVSSTSTTITATTTTVTTVTTTTAVAAGFDCCSLVTKTSPDCSCTTVEFFIPSGSQTGECVMDCEEGCCENLIIGGGNGVTTVAPQNTGDGLGCLDTCCVELLNGNNCCINGNLTISNTEQQETLCFDTDIEIEFEDPEQDNECDDDEAIIVIIVILVLVVVVSLLVGCYFCMKDDAKHLSG